jgi:thymidylate synthase (FAD)
MIGKVEILGHFGSDLMVVNAARTSFNKQVSTVDEKDVRLINRLAKDGHIAPLYHCKLQYRITCPIYVERQLTKTSVGVDISKEIDVDINSISGRYVDFSDSYTQIEQWRKQSSSSKQGSEGQIENQSICTGIEENVIAYCKAAYVALIDLGVAKEQARSVLPLNLNTTFIWTGSLWALIRLCQLRLKPDAQVETGDIVRQMLRLAQDLPEKPFEHTLKAYGL